MSRKHEKCLVCESENITDLNNITKVEMSKCKDCSFVFASNIPTEEELYDAYAKSYTREYVVSEVNLIRFNEYLDELEKYREKNNLLEIGAGVGYFAKLAEERGWNVFVTEFDDAAVEKCRNVGLTVHQGKLDSDNYEEEFFDVVFSTEVIEHINNPSEEVKHIHKILRKGGACMLTTPNFNSLSRKILKNNWAVIHYPGHLSYYTPKTIKKLFESNGFKTVWVKTRAISINKLINHSSSQSITKVDEDIRMNLEKNNLLKVVRNGINSLLNLTNSGDSLKALFIKK